MEETRIIDLTTGQLMKLIVEALAKGQAEIYEYIDSKMNQEETGKKAEAKPYYGIKGIAEILHCSTSKVNRMKKDGKLEGGYSQIGNSIVVLDPERLREIASTKKELAKEKRRAKRVSYSIINQ